MDKTTGLTCNSTTTSTLNSTSSSTQYSNLVTNGKTDVPTSVTSKPLSVISDNNQATARTSSSTRSDNSLDRAQLQQQELLVDSSHESLFDNSGEIVTVDKSRPDKNGDKNLVNLVDTSLTNQDIAQSKHHKQLINRLRSDGKFGGLQLQQNVCF